LFSLVTEIQNNLKFRMEAFGTTFSAQPLTPETLVKGLIYGAAFGAGFWVAGQALRAGRQLAISLKDKVKD
jgi:hypothetical protein